MLDVVKPANDAGSIHRWELIKELSRSNLDVYVMARENVDLNGVYTSLLPKNEHGTRYNLWHRVKYLLKIGILVHKHNIGLLYTRNASIAVFAILLKKIKHVKLVYEINGIASEEQLIKTKYSNSNYYKLMKNFLLNKAGFIAAINASAIIAVTTGIKNHLVNHDISENKIFVINNGVNTDIFKPVNDLSNLKRKYKIHPKTALVTFVGSLMPWQGVEHLIYAAPLILKKCPNTQFLIIGTGIMQKQWENLIEESKLSNSFIFTGNIPYEEVPLHINISDVCIVTKKELASGYSPLKLYEYMACAKPVVATNTSGFEILEQYNAGILINPKDPQQFANAVVKLLKDEQLRLKMGENGRNLITDNYSWRITTKKIVSVFGNLIE